AELFVQRFQFPSTKCIYVFANRNSIISHGSRKTSPNVMMFGSDENYLNLNGLSILYGRNLNNTDAHSGRNVCLLGYDVAKKLFKEGMETAVNSVVNINNIPYLVLGVLDSRGSTFGFSRDNMVVTSYENVDRYYPSSGSFVVAVKTPDLLKVSEAMGEAESTFRPIRK